jgi:hypothetical protein
VLSLRPGEAQAPPGGGDRREKEDPAVYARLLRTGILQGDSALRNLEGRVPKVRETIEKLRDEVRQLHRAKKPEKPPEKIDPKPVKMTYFRAPKEELTEQKSITFVCENKGISFVDFDAVNAGLKPVIARLISGSQRESFDFEVPGSDFRCRGVLVKPPEKHDIVLARLPARFGETQDQIRQDTSTFQRKISAHKTEKSQYYVDFIVFPDSFDAFLQAREIVWATGYDVGWSPVNTGEPLRLGSGAGIGVRQ